MTSNCWFQGYWWWVCPTGQSTAPQKFALWQLYGGGEGSVLPGSIVTSAELTAGQWNCIPLPAPLQLSIGNVTGLGAAIYVAATGFNDSFPITNNQFGAGDPYASGLPNGPLFAYSDQGASAPCPIFMNQGAFGTAGTDPSVYLPDQGSESSNFWIDPQISDTAPGGRTQFALSETCTLNNVWFYSPPFAEALPDSTQIWDTATQALVAGTDLPASWSGAVASGWVANSYANAGIVLPPGNYIATVYYGGGSVFYMESRGYFGSFVGNTGPATNGMTNGPLSSPANASAVNPPGGTAVTTRAGRRRPTPTTGTTTTEARTAGWTPRSPRGRA